MKPFYGLLLLLAGTATGCLNPARFDPEMRAACFDTLWGALESGHADVAAVDRIRELRPQSRQRVIDAQTRREYVVELARFLANFDDVHLGFEDLDTYWKSHAGTGFSSLISSGVWLGGRVWIEFSEAAVAAQSADNADALRSDRFYELASIDGIAADRLGALPLVFSLLRGEPGQTVSIAIRTDGTEWLRTMVFPAIETPTSMPSSAPAATPRPARATKPVGSVSSRRLDHDVGYIWLGDLSSNATVEAFHVALDALLDTNALVLDLRDNHGGTRGPIESVLGRFVDGVHSYATAEARMPRLLPLGAPHWWLGFRGYVWSKEPIYRRPVVVLMDATTLSSAEILASAMRELCGATLVGERTIGAGAAVATITLPDGLAIRYGAFLIRQRDGSPFQGEGIAPDIEVPVDRDAITREGLGEVRRWSQRVASIGYIEALLRSGVLPRASQPTSDRAVE